MSDDINEIKRKKFKELRDKGAKRLIEVRKADSQFDFIQRVYDVFKPIRLKTDNALVALPDVLSWGAVRRQGSKYEKRVTSNDLNDIGRVNDKHGVLNMRTRIERIRLTAPIPRLRLIIREDWQSQ